MSLCKYKDIFGKPGEGVHKYRIMDVAIVDLIMTIVFSYFIARYFGYDFKKTLASVMVIGIIAHKLFCVDTTINKMIFGKN